MKWLMSPATRLEALIGFAVVAVGSVFVSVRMSTDEFRTILHRMEGVCERLESATMAGGIRQEQHIHQPEDWWAAAIKREQDKRHAEAIR